MNPKNTLPPKNRKQFEENNAQISKMIIYKCLFPFKLG